MHRLVHYFASRWAGLVPLHLLLIRDMLILATAVNIVTTIASLVLLGADAPPVIAIAVFLLPLPYNLFIFLCVWRSAGQLGGVWGNVCCVIAALWLAGATIL